MGQFLCPTLVGREEEYDVLRTAVARARRREGGLILVTGEPGIGKSRLVRETAGKATRDGLPVMWGRAAEGSTPEPFRPLAEAILSVVRDSGPPDADALAPYGRFLGRLVPEWEMPQPADQSLVLVGEAVLRLLRVIAGDRACLIVLEDLHWADPETLAVVDYLADNVAAEGVLCVATVRPDEGTAGASLARSLGRRRAATLIEIGPLTGAETARMAAACLSSAELPSEARDVLLASAEGVPFLVEEILAAWAGDGVLARQESGWVATGPFPPVLPGSFAETVQRRIDALGPRVRTTLESAAMLGRTFDTPTLAAVVGVDAVEVISALRAAVDAQLVQVEVADSPFTFRFRHALTAEAVLASQLPPEQVALARRALDAIELLEADRPGPDRQALAADLAERAGDPERAAGLLLDLGRHALRHGALDTAEAALGRAREHAADHRELWLEIVEALVEVHSSAGRLAKAVDFGTTILRALPAGTPRAAAVHLRLARAAITAEQWDVARGHLDQVRTVDDQEIHARTDGLAALVAIGQRRPLAAEDFARSALESAEIQGLADVRCEALQVLGRCARQGDLEQAANYFDRALQVATEHDLPLLRIGALHERATIEYLSANDTSRMLAARDQAVSAGALALTAVLDVQIAGGVFVRWEPDHLMEMAESAENTARLLDLRLVRTMAVLWQAAASAQRGEGEVMERTIREALHDAEPDAEAMSFGWCRAIFALRNDDRDAALADLDAAERVLIDQEAPNPWGFRGLRALLRTLDDPGDLDAAIRLRTSGATVWWMNRAWLDTVEAIVAGRQGDAAAAEACFRRGDAALEPAPWFRHLTRRLVAEPAMSDGWGEPASWLRTSADFFGRAGHDRLRLACHALLRQAGEPVPRRGRGDSEVPDELGSLGVTSREVDVLSLVADRLGNREIAARLYLSPRTVEKHVASLIAKTKVADRGELANYADRVLP